MNSEFSLDHLSSTEFEEYCFDLLQELDFINIDWRKGTGLESSPSDSGRDIECELIITDIDGKKYNEKWFVDCKHYKKGVPPEKIQGILSWANAERPNKVLIIASNYLSNPCKDFLKTYVEKNKPPFLIKIWEKKELENLTYEKNKLIQKYKLSSYLNFIDLMHPLHLKYISEPRNNSINYFFSIMDEINPEKRDKILEMSYHFSYGYKEVNYEKYKGKIFEVRKNNFESFIVKSIVDQILEYLFNFSNKIKLAETINKNKDMVMVLKEKLDDPSSKNKEQLKRLIKFLEKNIESLPKRNMEMNSLYQFFCDEILKKLIEEEIIFKIPKIY